MIDGYEYQKRKRQEQKELTRINKNPLDESVPVMWIFVIVMVLALTVIVILAGITEKNNTIDCESIGGEYRVIDREWSAARKGTVDVYGCVK